MNSNFLKAFAALAILAIASSPVAFAAKVTPSEFDAQMKEKVGNKKGLAAANAAAGLLGKTLKDKLNKKYAEKYSKSLVKAIKKVSLKDAGAGKSINAALKQLLTGYFKSLKFNLNDKTYVKAQAAILKGLPPSARTALNSQTFYNSIKTFALKKGNTQDQVYAFYTATVLDKTNIPPPPVS